jgi:hypothetical protein
VNSPNANGYDAAHGQRELDDLDRWRFAAEIVDVVLATPSDWSARIGIFGKWGEGKSTVLRFAEHMLTEEGNLVFSFSPWAVQNWNDLWEEFGDRLFETLSLANIFFDGSWKQAAKNKIAWLESTGLGELAETAAGYFGKDKLYKAAFGSLSRWLKHDGAQIREIQKKLQDRRLVVVIDDLDRCAPDLIPQLLLSLRELLDLPGFTFLLAFDDEIVGRALTEKHPAWVEGSNFLEKILDFRFHLPPVTQAQKRRFISRAMRMYCGFVPTVSTSEIEDLLPSNPRKLKSLIRSMAALRPQLARHGPDELRWVDIWLAQMLRSESYSFFERLLTGDTLEKEIGQGYQWTKALAQKKLGDEGKDTNDVLKGLMRDVGVDHAPTVARLIQLVEAARARSSHQFRYACELAIRPHAVTWKEFQTLLDEWMALQRSVSSLAHWIAEHGNRRGVGVEELEEELFGTMTMRRNELLSAAAEAKSTRENESFSTDAGVILSMIEQFLLDLGKLNESRFTKLYEQASYWIGFRKNPGDKEQRDEERALLLKLLSAASPVQSTKLVEIFLPDRWDVDMGDGTFALKQNLRKECMDIAAPKAAREAISFMTREGAIRSLLEEGRFSGVKYCLFDPQSPLWKTALRGEFCEVIRRGQDDDLIYENGRDLLELLVKWLESGQGLVGREDILAIVSDHQFTRDLWSTALSRGIQYRLQQRFIQARTILINNGVPEMAVPLTEELQSRIDQSSNPNPQPPA